MDSVIDAAAGQIIRLPIEDAAERTMKQVEKWNFTLTQLGLEVSTGPVVAFRSAKWLRHKNGDYPLIWLNHVRPMSVEWPVATEKPQYVVDCAEAREWLVLNSNYVVIRRFSAKEDRRRIIAAPLLKRNLGFDRVGLENHLNFIHRPGGELTVEEAQGLAALLNSDLMDAYFRIVNGNTQVNASELRAMRFPDWSTIINLGRNVSRSSEWESAVTKALAV
ncbi:MAG: hypothetical protein NTW86_25145 [Candidatus Sumerlaeota bacterium]|nr:hypothetical protein [Candidatus Sumerlaeota bacterium]